MFKYSEIVNWIIDEIASGNLPEGAKLPTEKEMMAQFGVSRQSVRRAVRQLEEEGIVRSVRGSGIYVEETRVSSSKRIAVILNNYDGYVFPAKLKGINTVLEEAGYVSSLFVLDNMISKEYQILQTLSNEDYEGIILDGTQDLLPRADARLFSSITQEIPTVMLDSYYQGFSVPSVQINNELAGYTATKYLIDHGHRAIAYVGRIDYTHGIEKYKGYIRAQLDSRIPINDNQVFFYIYNQGELIYDGKMGQRLLDTISRCTAVFCYNDELAYNLIRFLNANGISVPDDISMVGFDHTPMPDHPVQVTSIMHPTERIGKKAAENLLQLIHQPQFNANYLFTPELAIGNSVLPCGT